MSLNNPTKPTVELEFDLGDIRFMNPVTTGSPPLRDTLVLRDRSSYQSVSIYAVLDGRIVPITVPDHTTVEIVVTR